MRMINFKHLNYVYRVGQLGSIAAASEQLHLTPQTLSGQISEFESRMGQAMFERQGRKLILTEAGQDTMRYAEEIFRLGNELETRLRYPEDRQSMVFRVGIADAVPKSLAQQILSPALHASPSIKLICREDSLEHLLADLGLHKLDLILADRAMPSHLGIKGYSVPLGECGIAFMAHTSVTQHLAGAFPDNLNGTPLLLPSDESALRGPLLAWLDANQLKPKIIGEFDDSALMKAFGESGMGVWPELEVNLTSYQEKSGIVSIGKTLDIKERYFLISAERHISHPATHAIIDRVRVSLFS